METLTNIILNCSAAAIELMIGAVIYYHYHEEIESTIARLWCWLRSRISEAQASATSTLEIDSEGKMHWRR